MYEYDTRPSRRSRDVPPISSSRYQDTGLYGDPYSTQPPRSSRPSSRYEDAEPAPRHHRRRSSTHTGGPDHRRAAVVASDDGRGGGAYGSAYPPRTSRHDVEAKTSPRNREFRERRDGYETDEAVNLRRAKSYSPRRAAREMDIDPPRKHSPQVPPKSSWGGEYGAAAADPYAASAKPSARGQQYYGEDAYTGRGGKSSGKDYSYGAGSTTLPRPPAGDYSPYKASPLSAGSGGSDEKLHTKTPRYSSNPAYPDPYSTYEPAAAAAAAPRRSRSSRVPDAKPERKSVYGGDEYGGYTPAPARGRGDHRSTPPITRGGGVGGYGAAEDDDPYAPRAPRSRQRQSVPPRSRYGADDPYDSYAAQPPPRRAASVSHGQGRYGGGGGYDDRQGGGYSGGGGAPAPAGGAARSGSSSQKAAKTKVWGKQAGKLFMTHAVPVIRQEAVPLLTKAAQAYMQQKAR